MDRFNQFYNEEPEWKILMKNKIAFCSLAFGELYVAQLNRLKESILNIYPDADLFFYNEAFPKGAQTMDASMYGFKPHVIAQALNVGFEKIIFFDPAMILLGKLNYYDELLKKYSILAVQDDTLLSSVTSDKCLSYFGVERDWLIGKHLVGGSFYYFDFTQDITKKIFAEWKAAEEAGIFGSQMEQASGQLQGHRNDETVLAMCLYLNGKTPLPYTGSKYNWDENPIMVKKHFK